jgi:hypothetical protein
VFSRNDNDHDDEEERERERARARDLLGTNPYEEADLLVLNEAVMKMYSRGSFPGPLVTLFLSFF